jgi:LacI family transcriptional regulator
MYAGLPQQLAKEFRTKIVTGQWVAGQRLPTTRQLATAYDVSINTVQNAFRVLEAQDLVVRHPRRGGFVKAADGEGFHSGRSRAQATAIGIVSGFATLDNPRDTHNWTYWITRAAEQEFARAGHHLSLLSASPYESGAVKTLLPHVERMREDLAGVLCFPLPGMRELLDVLDRYGIPWVTINRPEPRAVNNFVTTDNFEGGRLVGRCFARAGYERVVVLGHSMYAGSSTSDKYLGFMQGCLDGQLRTGGVDCVVCENLTEEVGYERVRQHVEKYGPPQGVFAVGDFLALGALRLCRERGLAVPGAVGVVGGTGLEVAQFSHPALTVLEQPMRELGTEAAGKLLRMMTERTSRVPGVHLRSPLVVRESFVVSAETLREFGQ